MDVELNGGDGENKHKVNFMGGRLVRHFVACTQRHGAQWSRSYAEGSSTSVQVCDAM